MGLATAATSSWTSIGSGGHVEGGGGAGGGGGGGGGGGSGGGSSRGGGGGSKAGLVGDLARSVRQTLRILENQPQPCMPSRSLHGAIFSQPTPPVSGKPTAIEMRPPFPPFDHESQQETFPWASPFPRGDLVFGPHFST